MIRVIVPLAEGFEETEFITVVDILRRAEVEVVTASLKEEIVQGAHKVKILADTSLDKIDPMEFDAIVLPGGFPGFKNLKEDERVLNMVREMNNKDKYIAAICGAPSVLIKADILRGRKATVSPSGREEMEANANYVDERVVVDRKLITSQSPGTAMEFALTLVEVLTGKDKMKSIKEQTLAICKDD
jgi:4-methyl-5(b-hydroxyethyl)-thiazole monophosphate biosynthesis